MALDASAAPTPPFSQAALAALVEHPGLAPAIGIAARGTLSFFEACDPASRWLFHDRGRYMTGLAAMALLGMGGLTLASLRTICATMGVSSPGRVNAFWTSMRDAGHLSMTRRPDGTLDRHLTASPELIDLYRRHRRIMIEAIAPLWPETSKAALDALGDDQTYLAMEAAICGVQAAHRELFQTQRDAPIFIFIERSAGLLILMHMLLDQTPDGGEPRDLSIHGLAKRFHVSRPHVKKLMVDAAAQGLVQFDESQRTVAFTPVAVRAYAETSAMVLQAIRIGLEMALATRRPL